MIEKTRKRGRRKSVGYSLKTPPWSFILGRYCGTSKPLTAATFGTLVRGDLLVTAQLHIPPRVKEAHEVLLAGIMGGPAAPA